MPTQRGAQPDTPGRKTVRVNVSMTPERLAAITAYAEANGWSRSYVIGRFIDSLPADNHFTAWEDEPGATETPAERAFKTLRPVCAHANAKSVAGGIKTCPDCGANKGIDGEWRKL